MSVSYNLITPPFVTIFNPYMPNDDVKTVKELADYLKVAEKTVYRFASEGKLAGFKVGGAWRFRKSEIDRWINEQERKEGNNG